MPNFIIVGYVWQILGKVGPFCPPREQPQKDTSWIGLTTTTAVWIPISFNHLLSTFYRNEILIPSGFIATQSVSSITDFFHIWFMLNICQILCLQFFNIGDKSRYIEVDIYFEIKRRKLRSQIIITLWFYFQRKSFSYWRRRQPFRTRWYWYRWLRKRTGFN